jgi:hypothetical protein
VEADSIDVSVSAMSKRKKKIPLLRGPGTSAREKGE